MDIHLTPTRLYGGRWLYQVWVDGKVYDSFFSDGWITNMQMLDVAAGYREYLEHNA